MLLLCCCAGIGSLLYHGLPLTHALGQKLLLSYGLVRDPQSRYAFVLIREEIRLRHDQTPAAGAGERADAPSLSGVMREIARLRRTLLKHGHAQELFQDRVQGAMDRLPNEVATARGGGRPEGGQAKHRTEGGQTAPEVAGGALGAAQLRSLVDLARAVTSLKGLAAGAATEDEDAPRSMREGLDLLGIRVSNLQRSFGLEQIPALGKPFDDRLHRAHGVCHRDDLPDGQVAEELLAGYLLDGDVERPALVIVNRRATAERPAEQRKATR